MNKQVQDRIEKYPIEIIEMFTSLRGLIYDTVSSEIIETVWAGMPSYYVKESFVRLIPFKDHINIEAKAITKYSIELSEYRITPKGMLQIKANQIIPTEILKLIFIETL